MIEGERGVLFKWGRRVGSVSERADWLVLRLVSLSGSEVVVGWVGGTAAGKIFRWNWAYELCWIKQRCVFVLDLTALFNYSPPLNASAAVIKYSLTSYICQVAPNDRVGFDQFADGLIHGFNLKLSNHQRGLWLTSSYPLSFCIILDDNCKCNS